MLYLNIIKYPIKYLSLLCLQISIVNTQCLHINGNDLFSCFICKFKLCYVGIKLFQIIVSQIPQIQFVFKQNFLTGCTLSIEPPHGNIYMTEDRFTGTIHNHKMLTFLHLIKKHLIHLVKVFDNSFVQCYINKAPSLYNEKEKFLLHFFSSSASLTLLTFNG